MLTIAGGVFLGLCAFVLGCAFLRWLPEALDARSHARWVRERRIREEAKENKSAASLTKQQIASKSAQPTRPSWLEPFPLAITGILLGFLALCVGAAPLGP